MFYVLLFVTLVNMSFSVSIAMFMFYFLLFKALLSEIFFGQVSKVYVLCFTSTLQRVSSDWFTKPCYFSGGFIFSKP